MMITLFIYEFSFLVYLEFLYYMIIVIDFVFSLVSGKVVLFV